MNAAAHVREENTMRCARFAMDLTVVSALFLLMTLTSPVSADVSAGDKAPDFQLGNVNGSDVVKLSNYTTKPTLLVFWVSWCSHCQEEVPVLDKVYKDLKSKGLNVLGVSMDDKIGDAREFVKEYNVSFPSGFAGTDDGHAMTSVYGVKGVPMMYVIDKGGVVKAIHVGETDPGTIRKEFADLGVK